MGKTSTRSQIQSAVAQQVQNLRKVTGLPEKVRDVQDMLQEIGERGKNSRCCEIIVVKN
jgi:hypothetical protein